MHLFASKSSSYWAFFVLFAGLLGAGPRATGQAPPHYTLTDLGSLTGLTGDSSARAINDNGQVTGSAGAPNFKTHAFLWTPDGTEGVPGNPQMQDLGSLSSHDSAGNSLNDSGVVVGYSEMEDYSHHAFYDNGTMQDMGTFKGGTDSEARGVNSAGQIVGTFMDKVGFSNAFLWFGGYTDVQDLLGNPNNGEGFGAADAIADNGQIAANGFDNDAFGAFLVNFNNDSHVLDWGGLGVGGFVNIHNISDVYAVNAFGDCAGDSYDVTTYSHHAVLFALVSLPSNPRYLYDLGTLSHDAPGGPSDYSTANGINDVEDVVGFSDTLHDFGHAFLWQHNGDRVIHDLNDLILPGSGWTLRKAYDINNHGQIVGVGDAPDGSSRAFLLTPLPKSIHYNVKGLVFNPPLVAAGATTTMTVTISPTALAEGASVFLSTDAVLSLPTSITVPANQNTVTVVFTVPADVAPNHYWISASSNDSAGVITELIVTQAALTSSSHLLWTNVNGQAAIWNLSDPSPMTTAAIYGPYPGWTAKAIAQGPDGHPRLLWTNTNGQVALWNLADPSPASTAGLYGPFPGWTATALTVGPDNAAHLLWDSTNGQVALWNTADPSPTATASFYGPYSGWTGIAIGIGADNHERLLWDNISGQVAVWNLSNPNPASTAFFAGPYSGWTANCLSVGNDNAAHLLWDNTGGQVALWNLSDHNPASTCLIYGPYSGWSGQDLSVGADNKGRLLWDSTSGQASLWNLTDADPAATCTLAGSYGGWTAVSIAAGH